jgi:hypothetical protein
MKDLYRGRIKNQVRFEFHKSDRVIPGLELQSYTCEICEGFTAPSSDPYFRALAKHGEHNKSQHPREYPAPIVMMVYKA